MPIGSQRLLGTFLLLGVVALSFGCGGGGSSNSGPSADAPVISDLIVRALDPERANTTIRYAVQVTTFDPQADVFNGTCEIALPGVPGSPLSIPINSAAPGINVNATTNPVTCVFTLRTAVPAQISGSVTIIDRAGHRSNSLSFLLGISERRVGPDASGGAPSVEPGSARLGR